MQLNGFPAQVLTLVRAAKVQPFFMEIITGFHPLLHLCMLTAAGAEFLATSECQNINIFTRQKEKKKKYKYGLCVLVRERRKGQKGTSVSHLHLLRYQSVSGE